MSGTIVKEITALLSCSEQDFRFWLPQGHKHRFYFCISGTEKIYLFFFVLPFGFVSVLLRLGMAA